MTKPDFNAVVNYHTFIGENLSDEIHRAAEFIRENPIGEDGIIDYSKSEHDNKWHVSVTGEYIVEKTLEDLK